MALNIVSFQQIKNRHFFPIASLAVSMVQVLGVIKYHSSFTSIIWVVVVVSIFHLFVMIVLHIFYNKILFTIKNLRDLFGLFGKIPNGKKEVQKGKLRILVFNWRDTKHKWAGGAEIYIHEIAKRWVNEGNNVTVFCGNDGKSKRHEIVDGVRVVRRGGFYTVYIWAFLYYVLRFRGQFDVVVDYENGVPFFSPLYSGVKTFLLVFHIHQEVFRENLPFPLSSIAMFVESRIMPFVYRHSKHITISNSSKNDIVRIGCAKPDNIEIVTPGIDLEAYKLGRKAINPIFVCVGRLRPYKNVDIAIKAFAHVLLKYKNAVLYIVGEGDSQKSLIRLVEELGIIDNVIFTGFLSEQEKIKLLGKAWVALQPSSFEGWGLTVIEANACGTPVIASNTNGLKDSVVDGKTGILVPVKNISILTRAMIELLNDKEYRKDLSRNAYLWAQKFSWDQSATKFIEALVAEDDPIEVSKSFAEETI
jgi:glycosyltransferase involved in cell wall biosynthesis